MDILTGSGEIDHRDPADQHADLFRGFPNSYGTLGYSMRLKIELEAVKPFVALRHLRFGSLARPRQPRWSASSTPRGLRRHPGRLPRRRGVQRRRELPVHRHADRRHPGRSATTPAGDLLPLDSARRRAERTVKSDRLTIHDYLWRWDTDWFWCSRAFGAQNPRIRRFWPNRLTGGAASTGSSSRLTSGSTSPTGSRDAHSGGGPPRRNGWCRTSRCRSNAAPSSSSGSSTSVPIEPIWLCPLRLRDTDRWPLYPIRPGHTYVNVGFWSAVPAGATDGDDEPADRDQGQ